MSIIRNILIAAALVVIAVMALNFISAIVPIVVTAIAAFILGRLSVHFDLLEVVRKLRAPAQAAAAGAATVAAAAPKAAAKPAPAKATKAVEIPAEKAAAKNDVPAALLDPNFEVKTSAQIEAEARLREKEAMERAKSDNADAVQAALEERRKRLLGGDQ